jgi:hypothetical protein
LVDLVNESGTGNVEKYAMNGGMQSFSAVLPRQWKIRRIFQAFALSSNVHSSMAKHILTI